MSTVEESDKEAIVGEFHKIRHSSNSEPGFNHPKYRSYMGNFLLLKEIFGSHLTSWSNKRWAELFRDGLQGSLLYDKAKELAKGVSESETGNFEVFRQAIETDAIALKQTSNTHEKIAAAAVREERDKVRKASAVGRTARAVTDQKDVRNEARRGACWRFHLCSQWLHKHFSSQNVWFFRS